MEKENENIEQLEPRRKDINFFYSADLLKIYYKNLFPAEVLYDWLSYFGSKNNYFWTHREFSFTFEKNGQEIYQRYNSFENVKDFYKHLIKSAPPCKIDIGGVFDKKPKIKKHLYELKVEQREVVFDLDLSDYDDVRTCCQDKSICDNCWPLMRCAIDVINIVLREDFGFENILFVFSGGRGVHCWIADAHARYYKSDVRTAIINYFSIINNNKFNFFDGVHDVIERAYKICLPYFESCTLRLQNLLDSKQKLEQLIAKIKNPELKNSINKRFKDNQKNLKLTSENKWKLIIQEFNQFRKLARKKPHFLTQLKLNQHNIVLFYTFPRIDVEVTRHRNHLLKSPFCIHPKTSKLCVPIDPCRQEEFSPQNVPTLLSLYEELEKIFQENVHDEKLPLWKSSPSMKHAIDIFKRCFLDLIPRGN